MASRADKMQALLDRRDEVIAKFKAVEKKYDREMMQKMMNSELVCKIGQDISPLQSRQLS